MRAWKFSKPKNPGFGISKQFYLSVLAAKAQLPAILDVVTPEGVGDTVAGLGAPLAEGASRSDLGRSMERGIYALATRDRTTVLRMVVVSKEEAGFDPQAFLRSELGRKLDADARARVSATWSLLQLTFESHHAMVYPALDFLLTVAKRLAILCDGLVADPLSEVYRTPSTLIRTPRIDPRIDAREHVAVHFQSNTDGLWGCTLGLRKFALPEFEIRGLEEALTAETESLLFSLSQTRLGGKPMRIGDRLGAAKTPLEIVEGGADRAIWEGIDCFELIPTRGVSASEAVRAWSAEARVAV